MQNVTILYEDEYLFVVVKPSGMPSQGERSAAMDMVSYLKNLLAKRDHRKNPYVAVIHRLDRPVGGVMVYAKTPAAAAGLSRQIARHSAGQAQGAADRQKSEDTQGRLSEVSCDGFCKNYAAVLCGNLEPERGCLRDYLKKTAGSNMSQVTDAQEDARLAVLDYEVCARRCIGGKVYSFVKIALGTGRHHQIRVQMAHAGAPVLGDMKYGSSAAAEYINPWKRELCLFASALSFVHPATGRPMHFEYTPQFWTQGLLSGASEV